VPGRCEINWRPAHPETQEQAVDYARGAALMVRKFFLTAMRQIDERYGTYGSDAELCFQAIRAGKRVLLVPSTTVLHHGRAPLDAPTRGARDADFMLGVAVYLRKRFGIMRGLLFRLASILRALGGLLSFHDFRYHFSLLVALVSGQKIDGTHSQ
jgi:GT2 family glycosyltransferase